MPIQAVLDAPIIDWVPTVSQRRAVFLRLRHPHDLAERLSSIVGSLQFGKVHRKVKDDLDGLGIRMRVIIAINIRLELPTITDNPLAPLLERNLHVPGRERGSARCPALLENLGWSLLIRPDAGIARFPQKEVFEDKRPFPANERPPASATHYLAVICLGTGFDSDDLIERLAVRTCEGIER
jgi:hypothetical protein